MLKLEAGKRYERRDGGRSGPLMEFSPCTSFYRLTDGQMVWYSDGSFLLSTQESKFDLVKEVEDPQPLEWKRGIPTEEECRECWIVFGGKSDVPKSIGRVYEPREFNGQEYQWSNDWWYLALRIKPVEPPKPKTKMVTQRKYITLHSGEVLWTHLEVPSAKWLTTTETQIAEVPA